MQILREALAEQPAQQALDKKAENARELGLDYEPQRWAVFCGNCRKEWSVSYPHPGKSICADCNDKPAQQEPVTVVKALPMGHGYPDMHYAECQHLPSGTKLYTTPPAQRTWIGLTDDEIHDTEGYEETREMYRFARAILAKSKEKNT